MDETALVERGSDIRPKWVLWLAGGLSVLAGTAAIIFPFAAAVGFEIFLGTAFIVVGVMELARAFSLRKTGRILAVALFGLLALVTGVVMLLYPIRGLAALTIVVAVFLIAGGLVKMWGALTSRLRRGWALMLVSGILSVIPGGLLFVLMPIDAGHSHRRRSVLLRSRPTGVRNAGLHSPRGGRVMHLEPGTDASGFFAFR